MIELMNLAFLVTKIMEVRQRDIYRSKRHLLNDSVIVTIVQDGVSWDSFTFISWWRWLRNQNVVTAFLAPCPNSYSGSLAAGWCGHTGMRGVHTHRRLPPHTQEQIEWMVDSKIPTDIMVISGVVTNFEMFSFPIEQDKYPNRPNSSHPQINSF